MKRAIASAAVAIGLLACGEEGEAAARRFGFERSSRSGGDSRSGGYNHPSNEEYQDRTKYQDARAAYLSRIRAEDKARDARRQSSRAISVKRMQDDAEFLP